MKGLVLAACLLAFAWGSASAAESPAAPAGSEQLLREQKHFLECLAVVYHPSFWISYNGRLYFQIKDQSQLRKLDVMKSARAQYAAFTDFRARYNLAAEALADSGLPEADQRKILLPFSDSNPNLTPTLTKSFRILTRYQVVQKFGEGDALLREGEDVSFVMDINAATAGTSGTNAWLVREGTKVYTASDGSKQTVEAFTSVGLSPDDATILLRASAAFHKRAEAINHQLAEAKTHREFADSLARADDSNPYLQYQVAVAYFEGKGAPKDEKLGLEWMKRAAQNGSGDAKAYLEKLPAPLNGK